MSWQCSKRLQQRIAKYLCWKQTPTMIRKTLELYRYIDGKLNDINANLAAQAVRNQAFNDALASTDFKFTQAIALEAERRECADCKIVNYVNSTFAPKLITDYTAGTTSAPAEVYNPLKCGCC